MAIISIPTSIGGINIPGGIFDGPLSDLDGVDGIFAYKYPRDLDSATKAHSVDFSIFEIEEVELKKIVNDAQQMVQTGYDQFTDGTALGTATDLASKGLDAVTKYGENFFSTGANEGFGQATVNTIKDGIGAAADGLVAGTNFLDANSQFLKEPKGKYIGHISLYMPEAFNLSAAISYDDSTSVASAMGSIPLLGKVIKTATNVAEGAGNEAFRVALNRAGYVFNPQKQVLFQGVEFRHFSMSFTFTPYSQAEAEQVKQIIQKFRMYAAPKRNTSINKNMFWVPPALFEIDFRMNGTHNKHLPKLQRCIINSIDVNYAPNGWTTHTDGAPVQTTMTLELQETSLIGRDEISKGY